MNLVKVEALIVNWLTEYCETSGTKGFIVGISGGIDSALTSILCAKTGKPTHLVTMPIRQTSAEYSRAIAHCEDVVERFSNTTFEEVDLTPAFETLEKSFPQGTIESSLAMANTRARLRMTTLYAVGQANQRLVAGTGNKIEDFGVGFYTKYGDGGVDLSPIADITKTEVRLLAEHCHVIQEILDAKPTDGLWKDGRSDEDQLGASYPELEWAMDFSGDESILSEREKEVLAIYRKLHRANLHKMLPIPVCKIPQELKNP